MRGKGLELDSNFQLQKCMWGVDRIRQLPDDILVHILSFLPLKEAGATSLVSRRWSHLWKYTPNLVFIHPKPKKARPMLSVSSFHSISHLNIEWVNSILNLHKAGSLKQFTISLFLSSSHFRQPLAKWLQFAFSRRVESLALDFQLTATTLTLDNNLLSSIQSSDCKFLKELTLERLQVSVEAIQWFLRNCPLLERLITRATLTTTPSESDLLVIEASKLKYLRIHYGLSRAVSIKVVSAPNLTRFDCSYDLGKLFLENVPNLVHASFIQIGYQAIMHHFANAVPKLETLSLFVRTPAVFPVPRQMPKLNKLILNYDDVNANFLLAVTQFLQASPCLQEFRLKIGDGVQMYYNRINSPIQEGIFEVLRSGRFSHRHLNVFEFKGFFPAADQMELVSYIVKNCVALEEITTIPICEKRADGSFTNMKKCTEQHLAALKLPHKVKLRIVVYPSDTENSACTEYQTGDLVR